MTKKQMVKELIKLGTNESESALMRKSAEELESMLDVKAEVEEVEVVATVPQPLFDMEALKAEMMAQLKAEMEANLKAEMMEKMKAETPTVQIPKKVVDIDRNRQIPLMNITPFGLVYLSPRSGAEWNWERYGDIEYMEMSELLTMRSSQRRFLDFPFVLIMDEEAVSYLGLEKEYAKLEKLVNPADIDKVFKLKMDDYKEVIDNAPKGVQVLIVGRAKQLILQGELDSMHKINYINEKFNADLSIENV